MLQISFLIFSSLLAFLHLTLFEAVWKNRIIFFQKACVNLSIAQSAEQSILFSRLLLWNDIFITAAVFSNKKTTEETPNFRAPI